MSGHSHWAGIKHKKGVTDQKRGLAFAKLLNAISVAAKTADHGQQRTGITDSNGHNFSPRLRATVERARAAGVPKDKIDSAIKRASESGDNLEELIFEAYGPGGAAIIIEAVSDSRNRTVAEIKKILNDFGGKWAEQGSVMWAFAHNADSGRHNADSNGHWEAKFPQELNEVDKEKLSVLIAALKERGDVQEVYTNAKT